MSSYLIIIILFICSAIPTLITLYITEKVKGSIKNSFDKKLEQIKKEHTLEVSRFQTDLSSLKAKRILNLQSYMRNEWTFLRIHTKT